MSMGTDQEMTDALGPPEESMEEEAERLKRERVQEEGKRLME
jgi:hypothetical protein